MEEVPEEQAKSNFDTCPFRVCLTLENGLFGRCSRGPTAHLVQKFKPGPQDHLHLRDIESVEELREKFGRYAGNVGPMRACAFCNGGNTGYVEAGAQFKASEVEALLAR